MCKLKLPFYHRRWLSKILLMIFLVGIVGIAFVVFKVYFPEVGDNLINNIESSSVNPVTAVSLEGESTFNEITTIEDVCQDLAKLGCVIVNVTETAGQGGAGFQVEYSEFRKVAAIQKIVFFMSYYDDTYRKNVYYLTTAFENIMVVWVLEERILPISDDEEPYDESPTSFEKVEIQSGICAKKGAASNEYWNVTLKMKNTGTATSTLVGCFINEIGVNAYNMAAPVDGQAVTDMDEREDIISGATIYVNILIDYDKYLSLTSGTTINIKIHSAVGMDYMKLIELV